MPPLPDHPLEAARHRRRFMIRVVRMAFFVLITTVALVTFIQRATDQGTDLPSLTNTQIRTSSGDTPSTTSSGVPRVQPVPVTPEVSLPWWLGVAIALGLFAIVLLIDVATPNKKISSISAVMFGLLAGVLATVAISAVIELALRVWLPDQAIRAIEPLINIVKPLLGVALSYLGITTILQTQDDFRLVIPYVEFAKQIRGTKPLLLDTSALIDARIADVAGTGILQAPLVVPRFVVAELQLLADSSDKLKRARGRRGLDVISRLQRSGALDVSIDETPVSSMAVDQALVELAQRLTARIVTTDHGLTRVAQIHGVVVLNVHEVAAAMRPALVPGEPVTIRIVRAGEQAHQGVGYLDDGTMVVTEHASALIGREAAVVVTSTIQTAAGRMVFARLASGPASEQRSISEESNESPHAALLSVGANAAAGPGDSPAGEHDAAMMPAAAAEDEPRAGAMHSGSGTHAANETDEGRPAAGAANPAPLAAATPTPRGGGPIGPAGTGRRPPSPRNPRR